MTTEESSLPLIKYGQLHAAASMEFFPRPVGRKERVGVEVQSAEKCKRRINKGLEEALRHFPPKKKKIDVT
jgi:hypothetical protein